MKVLCAFLATLLFFSIVEAQEGQDYLPLQIGNWWEYRWEQWNPELTDRPREQASLRTEVGPTTQIAGREYVQLSHHFGWGVGDTLWVRAEGYRVWTWVREEEKELLWLDFGEMEEGEGRYISTRALGEVHASDMPPWKWKLGGIWADSVFVQREWSGGFRSFFRRAFPEHPGWIDHLKILMFHADYGGGEYPVWVEGYVAGVGPVVMEYVSGWELRGQVILQRAQISGEWVDVSTLVQSLSWGGIKSLFE